MHFEFTLWFDVGIKRYTTISELTHFVSQLWFDVGIKRYTTCLLRHAIPTCCGLMQESKDIQRRANCQAQKRSCGLMQESKDIQHQGCQIWRERCCGLMQESKDIQRILPRQIQLHSCGLMQESKDIQLDKLAVAIVLVVV